MRSRLQLFCATDFLFSRSVDYVRACTTYFPLPQVLHDWFCVLLAISVAAFTGCADYSSALSLEFCTFGCHIVLRTLVCYLSPCVPFCLRSFAAPLVPLLRLLIIRSSTGFVVKPLFCLVYDVRLHVGTMLRYFLV